MRFNYCRIQGKELAANTMTGKGIFSMFNQMVNEYGYHQRSVKKNDLDGFIAVCKEFIEWVNAKYPREVVLQKERDDEKLRKRVKRTVARLKRMFSARGKG